jgi:hypothetical protein
VSDLSVVLQDWSANETASALRPEISANKRVHTHVRRYTRPAALVHAQHSLFCMHGKCRQMTKTGMRKTERYLPVGTVVTCVGELAPNQIRTPVSSTPAGGGCWLWLRIQWTDALLTLFSKALCLACWTAHTCPLQF